MADRSRKYRKKRHGGCIFARYKFAHGSSSSSSSSTAVADIGLASVETVSSSVYTAVPAVVATAAAVGESTAGA